MLGGITAAAYNDIDQQIWTEDELGHRTDFAYGDVEGNPTTNPAVATALATTTGPDPDGTGGPLARPMTRHFYDETKMGSAPQLSTWGHEITDAVRTAGTSGDGRSAPDSSFGVWEGTLNRVPNSSLESNNWWWPAAGATVARSSAQAKFGSWSAAMTATNAPLQYGEVAGFNLSPATKYTWSVWVYFSSAGYLDGSDFYLQENGGSWRAVATLGGGVTARSAGWHRLTATGTTLADWHANSRLIIAPAVRGDGSYDDGRTIYFDGAQVEAEKAIATPHVHTDGAAAGREHALVQAPASLIDETQGWLALRLRMGWASNAAPYGNNIVGIFGWGDSWDDRLHLVYLPAEQKFEFIRGSGGVGQHLQSNPFSFAAGELVTVIAAWTGMELMLSLNGAPFVTMPASSVPTLSSNNLHFGGGWEGGSRIDSDILWAATGLGNLANADASTLHGYGSETPGTWTYPPGARATAAWAADTSQYQTPAPAMGPRLHGLQAAYYENVNLSGRPKKLQNDTNVDFDWGAGGPAALSPRTDDFSIRWSGYLAVATEGDYTFATFADDGTRLTIDGTPAINNWVTQAPTRVASQPIRLSPGLHKLVLEYFAGTGPTAVAQLKWSCTCGISEQIIPASALRPGYFNQSAAVSPAGRTSFSHFADPAMAKADYTQVRLLDGTNLITSFAYDAYGRVTEKVMPKGNAQRTIDANGNLTGSADPTFATTYAYYGAGETAAKPAACGGGPAVSQAQLLKSTTPRGVAPTTFFYDLAGRQVAKTNGAGSTCSSYDNEGRLTSTKAPGDAQDTTYTYDPAGAQRTAADASGTVTSEYDEQGRLKRSVDSFGAEATFAYDAEGNMTSRVAAKGPLSSNPNYTTGYVYDEEGKLKQLTDPAGRPYSFFYDEREQLRATQYPNGTFSWADYNQAGWLTALYNRHGTLPASLPGSVPADASPLADFAYSYEQDAKKTSETRTGGGLATETQSFGYDALGRMETVKLPDGTLRRYRFDRDSNRTQITENGSETASYDYDPSNPASDGVDQLTRVTEPGQTRTLAHDADGNVTSLGQDTTLSWDGWGRHTGGTFSGTTVSYGFDPVGFRRQRVAGGITTRYLHGGLFETDAGGTITNTDVDGAAGDLAHFAGPPVIGSTVTYLYYNGHGDLAAQADGAGLRTNAFTYDPFGGPKQTQPANKTVEGFTGRWDKKLDTTSALIEMGVRPYDPKLGRFLATDPVEGGSANAYDYAEQDPLNVYDLDGTKNCVRAGCGLGSGQSSRAARGRSAKPPKHPADLFHKAGVRTTAYFERRLGMRVAQGRVTARDALNAYRRGRVFYDPKYKSYIRHDSKTRVTVVVSKPSGGKALNVFKGKPSPRWNPIHYRPG